MEKIQTFGNPYKISVKAQEILVLQNGSLKSKRGPGTLKTYYKNNKKEGYTVFTLITEYIFW